MMNSVIMLLSCAFMAHQVVAMPPRPSFVLSRSRGGAAGLGAQETTIRKLHQPFQTVNRAYLRKDLLSQCTERWRNATLDHFTRARPEGGADDTFPQRYYICANHWKRGDAAEPPGPIFFYLGNEADVLLYLNNTGLMWESAPDFGAMLVFAEHRYYGQSLPYGKRVRKHMGYLTAEQALADYAELIAEVKEEFDAQDAAVIGFGGSYGGMLAAWMRLKYPASLDGAIAGSAPIWAFLGEHPPVDPGYFAKGVTYDASELAGSAPACRGNVRETWRVLDKYGGDAKGRDFLAANLRLCPSVKLASLDDVDYLRAWLGAAWDYMAMGNFPYPSSYITNGHGTLPAFPVRAACEALEGRDMYEEEVDEYLLDGMAQAVGVYYNHTGDLPCYDIFGGLDPDSDADANFWEWQYCAEMFMPMSKDGVTDMFWPEPFDAAAVAAACEATWGITPRKLWATVEWGGKRIGAGSNIVFSNGLLDPWHGGGVLEDISDLMPAVIIPEGAHHLDLMFSHPDDPLSVTQVRAFQRDSIRDWVAQAAAQRPARVRGREPGAAGAAAGAGGAGGEAAGRAGGRGRIWAGARGGGGGGSGGGSVSSRYAAWAAARPDQASGTGGEQGGGCWLGGAARAVAGWAAGLAERVGGWGVWRPAGRQA